MKTKKRTRKAVHKSTGAIVESSSAEHGTKK